MQRLVKSGCWRADRRGDTDWSEGSKRSFGEDVPKQEFGNEGKPLEKK
jgi:hypothetical protein